MSTADTAEVTAGIAVEREGMVATLRIRNPRKHNAMTLAMWRQLAAEVHALDQDDGVRVLALRGAGDKAFVSGADIGEFAQLRDGAEAVAAYDQAVAAAQDALATCGKPTVACIQGLCLGGGIGLAMACDLRLAAQAARLRMPAARLGLGYALDGMQRMVQLVGAAAAFDIFYTARFIGADEALRMGLVNACFADQAFDTEVHAWLAQIAGQAPLSLRAAKAAVRASMGQPTAQQRATVDALVRQCFASRDYAEGRAAFAERRAPRFHGH